MKTEVITITKDEESGALYAFANILVGGKKPLLLGQAYHPPTTTKQVRAQFRALIQREKNPTK